MQIKRSEAKVATNAVRIRVYSPRRCPIVSKSIGQLRRYFFAKLENTFLRRAKAQKKISGILEIDKCYTSSDEGERTKARRGRNLDGKICLIGEVDREKCKITFLKNASA